MIIVTYKETTMLKAITALLLTTMLFGAGPVFKTGQTTVYVAGDDGSYQRGTNHNYTRDDVNGIVTDAASGLQWQDDVNTTMTWDAARTYCSSLDLNGTGWRLPDKKELHALVDYSRYDPALDPIFQNITPSVYWSATAISLAWGIHFGPGNDYPANKGSSLLVRCIRNVE